MFDAIGQIAGGIGLLVFGIWLLSENLKSLTDSRLRKLSRNLTDNRFLAFGWGLIVGGVTQSTTATMSIVVGLRSSRLISSRCGILILGGSPLGTTLFLLLLTIEIKFVALFILGITAIFVTSDRAIRFRPLSAVVFAVGFILFGFSLMTEAGALLSKHEWFREILDVAIQSLLFGFLIGGIITFVIHSPAPIVIFGIGMAQAGLIEVDHIVFLFCGCAVGQAFSMFIVSWTVRGTVRHMVWFSFFLVFLSAVFWICAYILDEFFGIPSVKTLFDMADIGLTFKVIIFTIFFCLPMQLVALFFPDSISSILSRYWPPDDIERLSRPKYIGGHLLVDAETSLDLVHLEQNRILAMFSDSLDKLRQRRETGRISGAVRALNTEISEFLVELGRRHPGHSIERRGEALSRQLLIGWLEEQFTDLCTALEDLQAGAREPAPSPAGSAGRSLEDFCDNLVEGIDGAMLAILHALDCQDEASLSDARKLTSERGTLMRKLRNIYTQREHDRSEAKERSIVDATIAVENLFFLLAQIVARATRPDLAPAAPRPAG